MPVLRTDIFRISRSRPGILQDDHQCFPLKARTGVAMRTVETTRIVRTHQNRRNMKWARRRGDRHAPRSPSRAQRPKCPESPGDLERGPRSSRRTSREAPVASMVRVKPAQRLAVPPAGSLRASPANATLGSQFEYPHSVTARRRFFQAADRLQFWTLTRNFARNLAPWTCPGALPHPRGANHDIGAAHKPIPPIPAETSPQMGAFFLRGDFVSCATGKQAWDIRPPRVALGSARQNCPANAKAAADQARVAVSWCLCRRTLPANQHRILAR